MEIVPKLVHTQSWAQLAIIQTEETALTPYLEALDSKKVKDSSEREVAAIVSEALHKAIFFVGHHLPSEEDFFNLTRILVENVLSKFKALSLNEIKLAINNGICGEYGDFVTVSGVQVLKWFKAYLEDQKRHAAVKEIRQIEESRHLPERTWTEADAVEMCLDAFEKFKKCGHYVDYFNCVYDILEKKGIINFSAERKKEIKEIVLAKRMSELKMPHNRTEHKSFKAELKRLLGGDTHDIRPACKYEALNIFFNDLINMSVELKTLIADLTEEKRFSSSLS